MIRNTILVLVVLLLVVSAVPASARDRACFNHPSQSTLNGVLWTPGIYVSGVPGAFDVQWAYRGGVSFEITTAEPADSGVLEGGFASPDRQGTLEADIHCFAAGDLFYWATLRHTEGLSFDVTNLDLAYDYGDTLWNVQKAPDCGNPSGSPLSIHIADDYAVHLGGDTGHLFNFRDSATAASNTWFFDGFLRKGIWTGNYADEQDAGCFEATLEPGPVALMDGRLWVTVLSGGQETAGMRISQTAGMAFVNDVPLNYSIADMCATTGDFVFNGFSDFPAGTSATVFDMDTSTEIPIFADGFESGDTSAWSSSCP